MVDFWWQIICRFSPGKIGLKFVTENFTTFFTSRKEICHLELTLGESSPKISAPKKKMAHYKKVLFVGGISKLSGVRTPKC